MMRGQELQTGIHADDGHIITVEEAIETIGTFLMLSGIPAKWLLLQEPTLNLLWLLRD